MLGLAAFPPQRTLLVIGQSGGIMLLQLGLLRLELGSSMGAAGGRTIVVVSFSLGGYVDQLLALGAGTPRSRHRCDFLPRHRQA